MAVRMLSADVGWTWLCETVLKSLLGNPMLCCATTEGSRTGSYAQASVETLAVAAVAAAPACASGLTSRAVSA
jgi:hypothetical protein